MAGVEARSRPGRAQRRTRYTHPCIGSHRGWPYSADRGCTRLRDRDEMMERMEDIDRPDMLRSSPKGQAAQSPSTGDPVAYAVGYSRKYPERLRLDQGAALGCL